VKFSRLIEFSVFLHRGEPKPGKPALALMAMVLLVVVRNQQSIVASSTPHMKEAASITLAYVVHVRDRLQLLFDGSVCRKDLQG
jgi:hypothetical protein